MTPPVKSSLQKLVRNTFVNGLKTAKNTNQQIFQLSPGTDMVERSGHSDIVDQTNHDKKPRTRARRLSWQDETPLFNPDGETNSASFRVVSLVSGPEVRNSNSSSVYGAMHSIMKGGKGDYFPASRVETPDMTSPNDLPSALASLEASPGSYSPNFDYSLPVDYIPNPAYREVKPDKATFQTEQLTDISEVQEHTSNNIQQVHSNISNETDEPAPSQAVEMSRFQCKLVKAFENYKQGYPPLEYEVITNNTYTMEANQATDIHNSNTDETVVNHKRPGFFPIFSNLTPNNHLDPACFQMHQTIRERIKARLQAKQNNLPSELVTDDKSGTDTNIPFCRDGENGNLQSPSIFHQPRPSPLVSHEANDNLPPSSPSIFHQRRPSPLVSHEANDNLPPSSPSIFHQRRPSPLVSHEANDNLPPSSPSISYQRQFPDQDTSTTQPQLETNMQKQTSASYCREVPHESDNQLASRLFAKVPLSPKIKEFTRLAWASKPQVKEQSSTRDKVIEPQGKPTTSQPSHNKTRVSIHSGSQSTKTEKKGHSSLFAPSKRNISMPTKPQTHSQPVSTRQSVLAQNKTNRTRRQNQIDNAFFVNQNKFLFTKRTQERKKDNTANEAAKLTKQLSSILQLNKPLYIGSRLSSISTRRPHSAR